MQSAIALELYNGLKKPSHIINMKIAMCILSTVVVLLCSTVVLKLLWIVRMGTLAHWSYIVGSSLYPKDVHGTIVFSLALFSFILIGNIIPTFLCPRVKFVATALSIPPQVHMLLLLNRNLAARLDNQNVTKTVRAYTAVTLISTFWTILSIVRT